MRSGFAVDLLWSWCYQIYKKTYKFQVYTAPSFLALISSCLSDLDIWFIPLDPRYESTGSMTLRIHSGLHTICSKINWQTTNIIAQFTIQCFSLDLNIQLQYHFYQASIVRTYFSISCWLSQVILAKAVPKPMVITVLPVMCQISCAKRYQPLIFVCPLLKN